MNNVLIKLKNLLLAITKQTKAVLSRFPLSIVCCMLLCFSLLNEKFKAFDWYYFQAILICGFLWFLSFKLYCESKQWALLRYYLGGILVFLPIAWYLSRDLLYAFGSLGMGLFLSVFVAPFIKKEASYASLWRFNYILGMRICFSMLSAAILMGALSAIYASLDFLFNIQIPSSLYRDSFIVVATLFFPVVTLAGIPKQYDAPQESYPRGLNFILAYILLPFLWVYTLILYGYALKILFNWTLPKGGIVYIVTTFGCGGIATYLASCPWRETSRIFAVFHRIFFKVLLVPILLLAVGIGVRVHEYGITELRYVVLLGLFWLSLSTLLAFFSKPDRAPRLIIISLVIMLMVSSFGPWGAVSVSERSQTHCLEKKLKKNQILVDGRIVKATHSFDRQETSQIISNVEYLVRVKRLASLKKWFSSLPEARINVSPQSVSAKEIVEDMGLPYFVFCQKEGTFYLRSSNSESNNFKKIIKVKGYDYFLPIKSYALKEAQSFTLESSEKDKAIGITFDPALNHLILTGRDTGETLVLDLETALKNLNLKTHPNPTIDLIIEKEGRNFSARLDVEQLNGEADDQTNKLTLHYFSAFLFLKINE